MRPRRGGERRPTLLTVFQAIVLGLVQGATEFAPVSSSGHLILVPWLFHWSILSNESLNKTFDVALHLGTFVGAVIYFWRDLLVYLKAWVASIRKRSAESVDERMAWFLVLGTIPGAIAGAAFESVIERKLGQPWLIGVMMVVGALILLFVDRWARTTRRFRDMRVGDALLIGTAQAVALQPGVSRSGITITTARALGFNRERAARFSFLLSIPIIGGAAVYKGAKLLTGAEHIPPGFTGPFLAGVAAAAVSGFVVIWWLLAYLRTRDFLPFVIYRLVLAALVFGVIVTGLRPATV